MLSAGRGELGAAMLRRQYARCWLCDSRMRSNGRPVSTGMLPTNAGSLVEHQRAFSPAEHNVQQVGTLFRTPAGRPSTPWQKAAFSRRLRAANPAPGRCSNSSKMHARHRARQKPSRVQQVAALPPPPLLPPHSHRPQSPLSSRLQPPALPHLPMTMASWCTSAGRRRSTATAGSPTGSTEPRCGLIEGGSAPPYLSLLLR